MENPTEKIYSILQKIALEMGVSGIEFKVERPKDPSHGDLASNIALVLFKKVAEEQPHVARDARKASVQNSKNSRSLSESRHQSLKDNKNREESSFSSLANGLFFSSPLELAEKIVSILNTKYLIHNTDFDRVEIAAPGFINFYLSKSYLQNQVQNIIREESSFGTLGIGSGKTASVEFVSANPTGPLHIGNARGGPLGDVIANVLQKAGFKVTREYLHNDVGGQVDRLGEAIYFTIHPGQKQKDYEVQYQGEYVKELSEKVKEGLGEEDLNQEQFIEKAGKIAVELMLTEILKDCEDMGIKYDRVRKESDLREKVPDVLFKIKKFIKEKDGAEWFAPASNAASPDEFLKDRETVVKKSDGQYTYFASDIAYHNEKLMQNDIVIDILGANHSGHVPRLMAVSRALGFESDNLKVVLYQWIRLKRGEEIVKMSKRAGTFVTAREVLDEVGKDAFRFFLLMQNSSTHMDFDLELARKKASDNPVFYVQYAYTRISSIFAKTQNLELKNEYEADLRLLVAEEEIDLIRKLLIFPDLVREVAQNFSVNLLTNYALDLATQFHKFYEKHQVISASTSNVAGANAASQKNLTQARLALLKATQITLKNTLNLLGVSAPEKM